ncbi:MULTISPECIES: hypothetical protein [Enterococcus]|uniref:hypothetical protein n=1 Tax=Enterococcus TaxID=1350 RepID=UPI0010F9CA31|nr:MULTISPECIES: hypothetical protein [Enterococcus]
MKIRWSFLWRGHITVALLSLGYGVYILGNESQTVLSSKFLVEHFPGDFLLFALLLTLILGIGNLFAGAACFYNLKSYPFFSLGIGGLTLLLLINFQTIPDVGSWLITGLVISQLMIVGCCLLLLVRKIS